MKTISRSLLALLLFVLLAVHLFAQERQEARLKPTDTVKVRISGVPTTDGASISGTYPISEDGYISLTYISRVKAAGLSPSQLGSAIQAAYVREKVFRKPTVVIEPPTDAGAAQRVIVGGEVRTPSIVSFRNGMTLFEAMTVAGGPTDFADMKRIRLMRGGQTTEHNLKRLSETNSDITLKPDDKIVVPAR